MNTPCVRIYEFEGFRFDADKLVLYYQDELLGEIPPKPLEVLRVILENEDHIGTYEDIIQQVWPDDVGADALRVNQYMSQLKKALALRRPDVQFLENIKRRGYRLIVPVRHPVEADEPEGLDAAAGRHTRLYYTLPAVLGGLVLVALSAAWIMLPENDEQNVERVLRESQGFETTVLYENPAAATESDLDRYWLLEPNKNASNFDRKRIREAIANLLREGIRYGPETKCERFDIKSLQIDNEGKVAKVRTLEKWFISTYKADGSLQRNSTLGPYFVDYILKNVKGQWFIEGSSISMDAPLP